MPLRMFVWCQSESKIELRSSTTGLGQCTSHQRPRMRLEGVKAAKVFPCLKGIVRWRSDSFAVGGLLRGFTLGQQFI